MALFFPAYEAWLAEREGDGELIQRIMLFNLFWSIGMSPWVRRSRVICTATQTRLDRFYLAGILVAMLTLVTILGFSYCQASDTSNISVHTDPI